jgi:hypothetical protein
MDLLTAYTSTHDSEVQVITAPSLISTIHKSTQHSLSLFQPAVSSQDVPCQRLRTVEILQLHALSFDLHRLRCRNLANYRLNYRAISFQPPLQRSAELVATILFFFNPSARTVQTTSRFLRCMRNRFQRERVYRVVAQKRDWYNRPLHDRCIATALQATLL